MNLKKNVILIVQIAALTFSGLQCAVAEDVEIMGSMEHSIAQHNRNHSLKSDNNGQIVQFLRLNITEEGKAILAARKKELDAHSKQAALLPSAEPVSKVQLGMNKVPVLNQGRHGSCVTFAITAALDAAMDKGDYISQLCSLQLGSYLERHSYTYLSGWDGTYPIWVIQQVEQYGVVSKEKQKTIGCGGVKEYPTDTYYPPATSMDPSEYSQMSEFVFGKSATWSNIYWRLSSSWSLSEVKSALNAGDRAVFAVILPRVDLGVAGAVGRNKTKDDSWVLTSEIASDAFNATAGHEMIITGYDDNAIAVDENGKKHIGLLTLRNSWGSKAGDNGDFYMSYDYFKYLTMDLRRVSPIAH